MWEVYSYRDSYTQMPNVVQIFRGIFHVRLTRFFMICLLLVVCIGIAIFLKNINSLEDTIQIPSKEITGAPGHSDIQEPSPDQKRTTPDVIHSFDQKPSSHNQNLVKPVNPVNPSVGSEPSPNPIQQQLASSYNSSRPALAFKGKKFILKEKEVRLLSGAVHYFRIVPDYWYDRLMKLKAMGLNTVETYMPWNLHEPLPGTFDFTGILDIKRFIKLAHKLGLNVIVRPGPYICSEWDNGGLPAWLLHDPNMQLRTYYEPYLRAIDRYFVEIFKILVPLQVAHGGPIIAFQVENEYASRRPRNSTGRRYMNYLSNLMVDLGVVELLFISDGPDLITKELIPDKVPLITVNFQHNVESRLTTLMRFQPDKPMMVMELWTGWFDHWGHPHLERDLPAPLLTQTVSTILKMGGSFNLYMFHGGTNFGFMSGANTGGNGEYQPDVTSYDYSAPLSEAGDITPKYTSLRDLLKQTVPDSIPNPLPDIPPNSPKASYGEVQLSLYIKLLQTMDFIPQPEKLSKPVPMEYLSINKGNGQAYGYVLYRTVITSSSSRKVTITHLRDHGVALLNGKPIKKLSSLKHQTISISGHKQEGQNVLDILVENCGRVNFGSQIGDRKGINGDVLIHGQPSSAAGWEVYSFEFKKSYVEMVQAGGLWSRVPVESHSGPTLFQGEFMINTDPLDTFLDMKGWTKGIVFINGANIGRYWNIGPQGTLYVPAPLLKKGVNKLLIFELHHPKSTYSVNFRDTPILNIKNKMNN